MVMIVCVCVGGGTHSWAAMMQECRNLYFLCVCVLLFHSTPAACWRTHTHKIPDDCFITCMDTRARMAAGSQISGRPETILFLSLFLQLHRGGYTDSGLDSDIQKMSSEEKSLSWYCFLSVFTTVYALRLPVSLQKFVMSCGGMFGFCANDAELTLKPFDEVALHDQTFCTFLTSSYLITCMSPDASAAWCETPLNVTPLLKSLEF